MARPLKSGLDYFPLDVDFFSDLKIVKLVYKIGGSKAALIYINLLCKIYKNGYYIEYKEDELPLSIMIEIAERDDTEIDSIIRKMVEVGLFNAEIFEKHHVLTSTAIQERYLNIQKLSKRKQNITLYNCMETSEEITINSEEIPINTEKSELVPKKSEKTGNNTESMPQIKENKIKENKIKEKSSSSSSRVRDRERIRTGVHTYAHVRGGDKAVPIGHTKESILDESTFKTSSGNPDLPSSEVSLPEARHSSDELEKDIEQLRQSSNWINEIQTKFDLNDNEFENLLLEFKQDCIIWGRTHTMLNEAQRHFANWLLRKQEINNINNSKTESYEYTRKNERQTLQAKCSFSSNIADYEC